MSEDIVNQIQISSEGHGKKAKIIIDGIDVSHKVSRASVVIDAGSSDKCTITFVNVPIELKEDFLVDIEVQPDGERLRA